jgi:hypothetical protein
MLDRMWPSLTANASVCHPPKRLSEGSVMVAVLPDTAAPAGGDGEACTVCERAAPLLHAGQHGSRTRPLVVRSPLVPPPPTPAMAPRADARWVCISQLRATCKPYTGGPGLRWAGAAAAPPPPPPGALRARPGMQRLQDRQPAGLPSVYTASMLCIRQAYVQRSAPEAQVMRW